MTLNFEYRVIEKNTNNYKLLEYGIIWNDNIKNIPFKWLTDEHIKELENENNYTSIELININIKGFRNGNI